jgi:hypothetical protein
LKRLQTNPQSAIPYTTAAPKTGQFSVLVQKTAS